MSAVASPEDATEIRPLLTHCAGTGRQVMITTALGQSVKGKFSFMGADRVQFEVPAEGLPAELLARSSCVVHFGAGNSSHVFVVPVLSIEKGGAGAPSTLSTEIPGHIQSVQQRNTYRVPVLDAGMIAAAVVKGEKTRTGRPIDVSMAGLQIAFPIDRDPEMKVGTMHLFILAAAGHRLRIAGEVRRSERRDNEVRYGVFFKDLMTADGSMEAPPDLRRIVIFLERVWIKKQR